MSPKWANACERRVYPPGRRNEKFTLLQIVMEYSDGCVPGKSESPTVGITLSKHIPQGPLS